MTDSLLGLGAVTKVKALEAGDMAGEAAGDGSGVDARLVIIEGEGEEGRESLTPMDGLVSEVT